MAPSNPKAGLLSLPPELRNKIYEHTCPCLHGKENYCNPILSRRLGNPGRFICYKCCGEVFLQVCRQTRAEISAILFGAHEFRFQLWMDHKEALEAWFDAISEQSVGNLRRFRMHTQYPDDSPDTVRAPRTGSAMPGYIAVDLDASPASETVVASKTWTQFLLEEPRKQIFDVANDLPRVNGTPRMTKVALLQMVSIVGWFGTRNETERQMVAPQLEARRMLRTR